MYINCIDVLTGELHLVPLMKILQLYPDFSYLDKAVIGDQKMAREREGDGECVLIIFEDMSCPVVIVF